MYSIQSWGDTLRLLVELSATAAFALSGLMKAAGKKLDAVGICVVAFLAAFGGGTLRDLLLDKRPFFGCNTPKCFGAYWPCACLLWSSCDSGILKSLKEQYFGPTRLAWDYLLPRESTSPCSHSCRQ